MRPTDLRTEFADRPLGVDPDTSPRFGWTLPAESTARQTAYRIQVIHDDDSFDRDQDDDAGSDPLWDSGFVESARSSGVVCEADLDSRERYRWRVKVRTAGGAESAWSDPSWFECGLAPGDWTAEPIAAPPTDADVDPVPAVRQSFAIGGEVARARLYVATGGTHVARLNGERVGSRELDTAFTDYEERVLYATHDVTDRLQAGENVLGFLLGRGRYAIATESVWEWQGAPWHADRPATTAQLEIEFADGSRETVTTDEGWEAAPSATRFDSIFAGERYDAREELGDWSIPGAADRGEWRPVERVPGPDGDPVAQITQPMRRLSSIDPDSMAEPEDGVYVFDVGEMVVGWTELAVDLPAGTELRLTHAEKLDEDGLADVSQGHVDDRLQTDTHVASGEGVETWEPQFTYRGFRYVQVEGWPEGSEPALDVLTGWYVHSNVEGGGASQNGDETGDESDDHGWRSEFACADSLLNRIHANTQRGLANNLHGIPTDSPTYEKNGWTGDVQATAGANVYNFDVARFYEKWLADCADAQRPDGELPPIVPTSDWGYADSPLGGMSGPLPGWDCAYVFLPWTLYRHYGDRRVLADHYEGMQQLVDFYGGVAEDHVVDTGLGDWLPPGSGKTADTMKPPEGPAITSTAYYCRMAETVAEAAGVLGHDDDAAEYAALAGDIAEAFHDRFWDADRGHYRTGEVEEYRQTSNVFPLAFGIVPDEKEVQVLNSLVEDVMETRDGHLNTGFHGTKYLLVTLADRGEVDVAHTIATRETHPSWGHWIVENDATALYESWELHSRSRDHPPYGSIDEFFYRSLCGIAPAEPGYERVEVRPRIPSDLDWASGTVETVRGPVESAWERTDDGGIRLEVGIPGNAVGEVYVPAEAGDVTLGGDGSADDIEHVGAFEGGSVWEVPPGEWTFDGR
ncbi:MAG: family 78 glycoside hydrolase catalytic domain [Halobacteriales archaeon]